MTPKLVHILWKDAFEGPSGWVVYSEYCPELITPVTVGWVFEDKKLEGYVTVYSTYFFHGEELVVADPNHIPVEMILEIKEIYCGSLSESN